MIKLLLGLLKGAVIGGGLGYGAFAAGLDGGWLWPVYGLAGAVWAGDQEKAKAVARRIRTGQVDVNGGGFNPNAPFGGYKQSGNGRELGKFGLEEFTEIKSMQL